MHYTFSHSLHIKGDIIFFSLFFFFLHSRHCRRNMKYFQQMKSSLWVCQCTDTIEWKNELKETQLFFVVCLFSFCFSSEDCDYDCWLPWFFAPAEIVVFESVRHSILQVKCDGKRTLTYNENALVHATTQIHDRRETERKNKKKNTHIFALFENSVE